MVLMPVGSIGLPFFQEDIRRFRLADYASVLAGFINHSLHSSSHGLNEGGVERLFMKWKSRAEEFIEVSLNGAAPSVQRAGGQWDFRRASPNISDLRRPRSQAVSGR